MNNSEWGSLTQIGAMFGVSSHKCGRWLAELGLRDVGRSPTDKAFKLGLVKQAPTNRGDDDGYFYIWSVPKTVKLLEEAGHVQVQTAK